MQVYADNAATTPVTPAVLEAMTPWLMENYAPCTKFSEPCCTLPGKTVYYSEGQPLSAGFTIYLQFMGDVAL